MIKGIIIIGVLMIMLCHCVQGQLSGNYKSAEYNFFERGLLFLRGIDTFVGGNDLTLNSDSSYHRITCSIVETGNWSCTQDSLFLFAKTVKWRIDSLQNVGYFGKWPTIPIKPTTYQIANNELYREIFLRSDENVRRKAVDKLIKNNLP